MHPSHWNKCSAIQVFRDTSCVEPVSRVTGIRGRMLRSHRERGVWGWHHHDIVNLGIILGAPRLTVVSELPL